MNEERFKALFKQYINDSLPPEDLLELQGAIQEDRYQALFDNLVKDAFIEPAFAEINDEARQSVFNAVSSRINQQENAELKNNGKRRLVLYRWLTGVAAMLFVALGAGLFFMRSNDEKQKEKEIISVHEIKPGINQATLTLANGKQVILTDSLHGQLSNEAGVKISKTKHGEIIYTITADENSGQQELQYNTLTTKRSQQFQVILPDGSHVWLDAASSLKYPVAFKGNERKVELTGQGYFEVSHDVAKPFIVKTTKTEVQVLGTHFNVSAYDDDQNVKTTLLEGSVRIKSNNATALLKPGEQAVLSNNGHFSVNTDVDLDQVMAWRNGLFNFNKVSLQEVMRQIARWYDVEIEYQGQIKPMQFGGEIQRDLNLSDVLEGLKETGIHFRIEGRRLIVLP